MTALVKADEIVDGEIVEELSVEQAEALTVRLLKEGVALQQAEGAYKELLAEAFLRRVWEPLGYANWGTYRNARLPQVRLDRTERKTVVTYLHGRGLSTRAIACATGAGKGTVERDMATAPGGAVEPLAITGTNGKTYRPKAPKARPVKPRPTPVPPAPPMSRDEAKKVTDQLRAEIPGMTGAIYELIQTLNSTAARFGISPADLLSMGEGSREQFGNSFIKVLGSPGHVEMLTATAKGR